MRTKNIWSSGRIQKRRAAFYNKIDKYYQDEIYTDVNIICQNRKFKCHRLALAAASEYFHLMFSGNFAESRLEDVVLHDIDSGTFEQILLFVYRGEIATIDDDNVFNFLRASDILRLNDIEDLCVHYLTQKNIPMDCALEIYLFASALRKVVIIPAVSRFIMQHLDRFSQESKFLEMSFEDFSALLTHFHSLSAHGDTKILNAICSWVCRSTDIRENRRSSFVELAKRVQLKFVSAELVEEYFDNVVDSDDNSRLSEVPETDVHVDPSMEMNELSLHVYIGTSVKETTISGDDAAADYWFNKQTAIFSMQENGNDMNWNYSRTISPAIQKMRIVESDGRLYYLTFQNERSWTFSSSTAFDLCTNVQSLALPTLVTTSLNDILFDDIEGLFSLCSLKKNIYLSGLRQVEGFQCYSTELDMWSPNPVLSEYKRKNLVNDDARLYMIYRGLSTDNSPHFAAYDPRVGKVEKLNDEGLCNTNCFIQPGCYHKGRIYLPDIDFDEEYASIFKMAIYDTAAGRWDLTNFDSGMRTKASNHRLVSLNNRLCLLGLMPINCIFAYTYDSYLQEWTGIYMDGLHNPLTNAKLNFMNFTDVLAYKSSSIF